MRHTLGTPPPFGHAAPEGSPRAPQGRELTSWGRHFRYRHTVHVLRHRCDDLAFLQTADRPLLPFGHGRSYGDSCLNDGGILIDTSRMDRFIRFDADRGLLQCEAGTSFSDILALAVPRGWFLPVTPGTRHTTVGGAIGNDVHGKNHHGAGTFGRHVVRFELARSDGTRRVCSAQENQDLFRATIGGLGLTGLVTWAEIRLKPIVSTALETESIRFDSLDGFLALSEASSTRYEYTVAWVDSLAPRSRVCRGVFFRGNHSPTKTDPDSLERYEPGRPRFRVPCDLPGLLLNRNTMRAFNALYYHRRGTPDRSGQTSLDDFFYPLDAVENWNRIYGRQGVYQCQFLLPPEKAEGIAHILGELSDQGTGSFLAILKEFGQVRSPGILSFPRPGITLTLDFPNRGRHTTERLSTLYRSVFANGGRFYPAKDSLMTPSIFRASFPEWESLLPFVDPRFSSSFWRRVTQP